MQILASFDKRQTHKNDNRTAVRRAMHEKYVLILGSKSFYITFSCNTKIADILQTFHGCNMNASNMVIIIMYPLSNICYALLSTLNENLFQEINCTTIELNLK